ncbi:hypothetical protein ACIQCJ_31270 [Streptomyces sp. NPDC093221]|uniref:hypothetical protein n=1 Tax=Streptomyces sp. NPDC093221 TaxID=3366032 RepID=UPI00382551A1
MTLRRTKPAAASTRNRETERLLARRRSIIIWCDRHLIAIHALSALITDDPVVVEAAMAEVLAAPDSVITTHRTRSSPVPPHVPHIRDRCPETASVALDRVELALMLIGDQSCADASQRLGVSERSVSVRLNAGLSALFAPCDGDSVRSVLHGLPTVPVRRD